MVTFRRVIAPLGLVLLLAGCASPSVVETEPTAVTSETPLAVTAYQGSWSDPSLVTDNAARISVLAVDGINLAAAGEFTAVSDDTLAQLDAAHAAGLPAELMVGNFDAELDDFSEKLAWTTFSDGRATTEAVDAVVAIVEEQGWDGVSVDMESLTARDTAALTSFVTGLRASLGADKTISIALMLEDSVEGYEQAGYDLGDLLDPVDRFILMAYDQHGPWDPAPGPIGALDWQRAGLEALLEVVPVDQVELGIAGYGYRWGEDDAGSVSVDEARDLAGEQAAFDTASGEWTATLADGTVLWWSDAASFDLREQLAREYDLHGVALWALGSADPL